MKKLQRFKIGEAIPDNAKFIKEELVITGYEKEWTPMGTEEDPIYETAYLYEVPEENK